MSQEDAHANGSDHKAVWQPQHSQSNSYPGCGCRQLHRCSAAFRSPYLATMEKCIMQSILAQALQCPCPQALLCSDLRPEAAVFLRSSTLLTTFVAATFAALSAALTPAPTTAPTAFSALRHRHWVSLSTAQVSTHDTLCCMWTDCSRSANLNT